LAETGFIGWAALVILISSTIFVVFKSWQAHQGLSRVQLGGLFAALAGVSVHSLVETPQTLPALMVILAVYVGLLESGIQHERRVKSPKAGSWVLAAAVVGLLLAWGWSLFSSRPYYLGVEAANQQAEHRAAALFETALDRDSHLALTWFQSGLNHGKLAVNRRDPDTTDHHLMEALKAYQEGLTLESNYSVNWMNLGLVYWQAGQKDRGLESVRKAVELAPGQAGFQLTYGKLLEETGRFQLAEKAYFKTLALQPAWAESAFFRASPFRERTADKWNVRVSGEQLDAAARALADLKSGRIDAAWDAVKDLPRSNNPEAFYLSGLINIETGNYEDAESDLRTARWMDPKDPWLEVEINLALGKLLHLQGNHREAAEAYSRALSSLERYSSFGFGTLGVSEYGWYIYYRPAAAVDLMPGFEVIQFPDSVVKHFPDMIISFEKSGKAEEARSLTEKMSSLSDHRQ
jgi:tetratricopeptide (TPR) repeat protein